MTSNVMSSREGKCWLNERTFEVGHESFSPGIEGIHDHLSIGRASDLDPSVLEARGRGCADPRTFCTDVGGLRRELEFAPVIKLLLNGLSGLEEGLTGGVEGPVEDGQELDCIIGEYLRLSPWGNGGKDLDALYSHECVGRWLLVEIKLRGG